VDVQLVTAVEHEGNICARGKVQRKGAVQAAAVKPPQLAPRAGAGNDELRRLQGHHSTTGLIVAHGPQLDAGTFCGRTLD
jgi:hypothetical protein